MTLTKIERIAEKEKNMILSESMKDTAIKMGLCVGCEVIVKERTTSGNQLYASKKTRKGTVISLYPHHFYCEMADGTKESFQYNEVLGNDSRMVEIRK